MIRMSGSQTSEKETASNEGFRPSYRQTYQDIGVHSAETNVLQKLRANIAQLEDLHGRLKFMMSEVSYLIKKS